MLRKFLNVYPDEKRSCIFFLLLGLVWSTAAFLTVTVSDALFLDQLGAAELPYAYMYTAFALAIVSIGFLKLFNRYEMGQIFQFVTAALFAITVVCAYLYWHNANLKALYYFLKVFCYMGLTALTTCYWTFIDQYYGLQIAKRLFALFYASVFAGTALSGGIISLFFVYLKPGGLLLLSGAMLILTALLVRYIENNITPLADDLYDGDLLNRRYSFVQVLKAIVTSRFTLALILTNVLILTLQTTTEYNYYLAFAQLFEKNPSELPGFLGSLYGSVYFGNIFYGALLYSRMLRRMGLDNIIMICPIYMVLLYLGWVSIDHFFLAIAAFIGIEGVLGSIDDNNFNLLMNAVPGRLKCKIRVLSESFFEPIGFLMGSILLLIFQHQQIKVGLVLSILLFCVSLVLRASYKKGIFTNLKEQSMRFEKNLEDWISLIPPKQFKNAEELELKDFAYLKPKEKLFVLESAVNTSDYHMTLRLLKLFSHEEGEIKKRVLNILEESPLAKTAGILEIIQSWGETTQALDAPLMLFLAKHDLIEDTDVEAFLNTIQNPSLLSLLKDPSVKLAEFLKLIKSSKEEELLMILKFLAISQRFLPLEVVLELAQKRSLAARTLALEHLRGLLNHEKPINPKILIKELKRTHDKELRLAYIKALGETANASHMRALLITAKDFRPPEKRLIEKIVDEIGLQCVPPLIQVLEDGSLCDRIRVLAGKCLGRIAPDQLKKAYLKIILDELKRAYIYYYHSHLPLSTYPHYDLHTLESALKTSFQSAVEFIIHLLGLSGSIENTELLVRSLRSHNEKVKSNAVETLEKACHSKIYSLLHPLISPPPMKDFIKLYKKLKYPHFELKELLDFMESSSSVINHLVSATLKAKFALPDWAQELRSSAPKKDKIYHLLVHELLNPEPL